MAAGQGAEVEGRPPLLSDYPWGHRPRATLKIPGKSESQHMRLSARCTRGAVSSLFVCVAFGPLPQLGHEEGGRGQ